MVDAKGRKVLNVGCGPRLRFSLHKAFQSGGWREVRLDVDAGVEPDIVANVVDMRAAVADGAFDAVWSSHNVEHLFAHEAPRAFREFRRVLRPEGFALVTCPDLESVAKLIVEGRFGEAIYDSAAGPIGVLDMIYGHARAIAEGQTHMAHRTGYTAASLGRHLTEAGFAEVWVMRDGFYDLWAVALRERADAPGVHAMLTRGGLALPNARRVET